MRVTVNRLIADQVIDELRRTIAEDPEVLLYAILDGARDRRIFDALWLRSDVERRCLYRGELSLDLATAAPYLVHLQPDGEFLRWLVQSGWGDSWGIFVVSKATIDDLRRHFRTFLMVYNEAGRPVYFRYYDPRVLRGYLPTCTQDELRNVFGPVVYYICESEAADSFERFVFAGSTLASSRIRLAGQVAG